MKKILILALALLLLSPFVLAAPQPQKELQGQQMIPRGAPWIADDQKLYFGDDKDAYIEFDADGTGAATFSGLSTLLEGAGVSIDSGEDLTFEGGDSKADFSAGSGVTKTTTGVFSCLGSTAWFGGASNNFYGTGLFGGALSAASILSNSSARVVTLLETTDFRAADDALVDDDFYVDGTSTVNNEVVNTTLAVTGVSTLQALALGVNATTTVSTTLTASNAKTVYPVDASAGHVTLTLPDASTNAGRVYVIDTIVDMGTNNIVVATTGSGKLGGVGGADTLTSTDILASLTLVSDGTHYARLGSAGTWT